MDRLNIDYSMSKGHKTTYMLLGTIHILVGGIALIGALFQQSHILVICGIALYTGIGIIILGGIFNKLHKYIIIDDEEIVFKSNFNRSANRFRWDQIRSVVISPSIIRLTLSDRQIEVNMGILRFRDAREIKNKIEQIAHRKGIPCVRLKHIARPQ